MILVFDYDDYKDYLKDLEAERSSVQKGFRSRLAEVLTCQNAYISQVLNGHAHFSLEQGLIVSQFLKHNELEGRYFLLLIEHERAGTKELKKYFQNDLQLLREKFLNIKSRLDVSRTLDLENQSIYYSNWIYATIHILVTIPEYRDLTKLISAVPASADIIKNAVLFLIAAGLLIEKKGLLCPGPAQLHLDKSSPHIRQHHTNWRLSAIQSLTRINETDIHYSTVSSLSIKDVEILKSRLIKVISDYVKTVQDSKEETLYNFNLDFYSLIQKK